MKQREQGAKSASYSKYYKIFSTKFNLSFGNPRTDVCSFCELKKVEIKNAVDQETKQKLMTEARLHKLRAKKFYDILREPKGEDVLKICFDMQQNQPLPKLSIGDVYYMRQLWLYNLTIMVHSSTQNKNRTLAYTWTENQSGKGCNEVSSALLHFLQQLEESYTNPEFHDPIPQTLHLFSDSCPGQNKNSAVMMVLLYYVQRSSIFTKIVHTFPIRGHSFLPPDRVFGRIEKKIRREEKILTPNGYFKFFEDTCTVMKYGEDWQVKNYKQTAGQLLKSRQNFKISDMRVFTYVKGKYTVSVKDTYTGCASTHEILKKNAQKRFMKTVNDTPLLPCQSRVSEMKRQNVLHLLKHLDLDEEAKMFYNEALEDTHNRTEQETEENIDENEPFL